jgi:hypothetical protein
MRLIGRGWAAMGVVLVASAAAPGRSQPRLALPATPLPVAVPAPKLPNLSAAPMRALAKPVVPLVRPVTTATRTLTANAHPAITQTLAAIPKVGTSTVSVGRARVQLGTPAVTIGTPGVSLGSSQPPRLASAPRTAPILPRTAPSGARQMPALLAPTMLAADAGLDRLTTAPLAEPSARVGNPLVGAYPNLLDTDELGRAVVRGRVVLIDPPQRLLGQARDQGFTVTSSGRDELLDAWLVTLAAPAGLATRTALQRLRTLHPALEADYDHVYAPAGGNLTAATVRPAGGARPAAVRIGMVDGGVAAHPSLAGRVVEQRGFAGQARPTGHGTAVASLLVGSHGRFRGAASGASLFVADVYGGRRASGSATNVVRALHWLASKQPHVINISLVGPPNLLMRRAVLGISRRGIPLIAAVGNDGPAAPPQYPASYPGVISVTAVDGRGMTLLEAGNAAHISFGAPGADMAAARPGAGYARVRGTSFAAPLAAGRLATLGSLDRLAREALPGKGRVGRGIVCFKCRVEPRIVGAK